jgi:hypothetical protein
MAKHRRLPGDGRHRLGSAHLIYCRQIDAVRTRLAAGRPPWHRWLWYGLFRLRGRHTVPALMRSGARPRPAFVLIASL